MMNSRGRRPSTTTQEDRQVRRGPTGCCSRVANGRLSLTRRSGRPENDASATVARPWIAAHDALDQDPRESNETITARMVLAGGP